MGLSSEIATEGATNLAAGNLFSATKVKNRATKGCVANGCFAWD
jgi:hypothetical protein